MKKVSLLLANILLIGLLNIYAQIQIGSDIDGEAAGDWFGSSVSLSADGSVLAIGALGNDDNGSNSGHVRIYENIAGTWTQLGNDIDGEAAADSSGIFVSLNANGSIVAIGGIGNDGNGSDAGHVRIFQYTGGVWTQLGNDIDGEGIDDYSGFSVSLSADGLIVAIGAPQNNGNGSDSGHVKIYQYTGGVWTQIGNDIDGEVADDGSGISVSLSADGSVVAIGALANDDGGFDAGHVRIFQYTGGVWTQLGNDIDGEAANDLLGFSVSLSADGSVVAIGGNCYNNTGYVRIYQYTGGVWSLLGNEFESEAADDGSGFSVSLSANGSVVAIGAPRNDDNGSNSGHTRIFQYTGGAWTQLGTDIDGEAADDRSGISVSLSPNGSVVAIGASRNDGNGSDSGHVRIYTTGYVAPVAVPLLPIASMLGIGLIGLLGYFRSKRKRKL